MQSQAKLFCSDFFFSEFLFVKSLSEHLPLPQGREGGVAELVSRRTLTMIMVFDPRAGFGSCGKVLGSLTRVDSLSTHLACSS